MIKIVTGNMFDYPSEFLLIGSKSIEHSEKIDSFISKLLTLLRPDELNEFEETLNTVQEYGMIVPYVMKDEAPFNMLLMGYPGTELKESFESILNEAISSAIVFSLEGKEFTITLPIVETNVSDLPIEKWAESFNKVIARLTHSHTKAGEYCGNITIVCETQEQANYLNKTILSHPEVV